MSPHKERVSNLDKCLSPYLNIIYKRPIKYPPTYPHLLIKRGSKCKTAFDHLVFTIAFNFDYVHIINCDLNKCIH